MPTAKASYRTLCYSVTAAILLAGCSYNPHASPTGWLNGYGLTIPTESESFTLCTSFGCSKTQTSTFTTGEFARVKQLFSPEARSPEEERQQIAKAIALMEKIQGDKVNTAGDLAKNNTGFMAQSNQLDCIAETANTYIYLILLENAELLTHHQLAGRVHRGPFTLNAPHNSAAIKEVNSGESFAVDSWFGANGQPPWITSTTYWLSGASPRTKGP